MKRRDFLGAAVAATVTPALSPAARAQSFETKPGKWRTFEIVTRVDLAAPSGTGRTWIPVPSVDTEWQKPISTTWKGNAATMELIDRDEKAPPLVYADWSKSAEAPWLEVTSRFRTQDRGQDWKARPAVAESDAVLAKYVRPTELITTDGIVKKTADDIVKGKTDEVEKVRALYEWVVANSYREPKVRGCGIGDIRTMLDTMNLGGKCADLNALFVGFARSQGIPARDVYGIRVAKSANGYKALGAGSPDITRAQHCRAEVYLKSNGWVAMDPADVLKVMREETPEWIKTTNTPLIAPVYARLFGGWEGNWVGYNTAHDVVLPRSGGAKVGFFMYPQAQVQGADGLLDSLDPDHFKYRITAREIVDA